MPQVQTVAISHSDIAIPANQTFEGTNPITSFGSSLIKRKDFSDLSIIFNRIIFDIDRFHNSPRRKEKPTKVNQIVRTHYAGKLITIFNWLGNNHSKENPSLIHLTKILNIIKEYSEKAFADPFSSFLLAVFDGLANNDTFKNLPPATFVKIATMTKNLNNQELKDYEKVDKAIAKLETLGINTLPY